MIYIIWKTWIAHFCWWYSCFLSHVQISPKIQKRNQFLEFLWCTSTSNSVFKHLNSIEKIQNKFTPCMLLVWGAELRELLGGGGFQGCTDLFRSHGHQNRSVFFINLFWFSVISAHNSNFPYVKCNYIWHIVRAWYVHSNGKQWW